MRVLVLTLFALVCLVAILDPAYGWGDMPMDGGDSNGGKGDGKGEKSDGKGGKGDSKGEKGDSKGEKGDSKGEKGDSKGEKGDSKGEKSDSKGEKGDSKGEKGDSKGEKSDSKGEKSDSKGEKGDSKGEKGDSKGEKGDSKGEKGDSKGEKSDSKGEKGDSKGEKGDSKGEKSDSKGEKGDSKGGKGGKGDDKGGKGKGEDKGGKGKGDDKGSKGGKGGKGDDKGGKGDDKGGKGGKGKGGKGGDNGMLHYIAECEHLWQHADIMVLEDDTMDSLDWQNLKHWCYIIKRIQTMKYLNPSAMKDICQKELPKPCGEGFSLKCKVCNGADSIKACKAEMRFEECKNHEDGCIYETDNEDGKVYGRCGSKCSDDCSSKENVNCEDSHCVPDELRVCDVSFNDCDFGHYTYEDTMSMQGTLWENIDWHSDVVWRAIVHEWIDHKKECNDVEPEEPIPEGPCNGGKNYYQCRVCNGADSEKDCILNGYDMECPRGSDACIVETIQDKIYRRCGNARESICTGGIGNSDTTRCMHAKCSVKFGCKGAGCVTKMNKSPNYIYDHDGTMCRCDGWCLENSKKDCCSDKCSHCKPTWDASDPYDFGLGLLRNACNITTL